MKKNHRFATYFLLALLLAGVVVWYFTGLHYLGGFVSGFSFAILILAWVGRIQARKAADIIDKKIRDVYQNTQP